MTQRPVTYAVQKTIITMFYLKFISIHVFTYGQDHAI